MITIQIVNEKRIEKNILTTLKSFSKRYCFFLICLVPILAFLVSFDIGRDSIPIDKVIYILFEKIFVGRQTWTKEMDTILFDIRLPRIVVTMIVGALLSVSGTAYQGLFKNPMASPDILGASSGAGFGVALGIILNLNVICTQVIAFLFGILAVVITCIIVKKAKHNDKSFMIFILVGIMISALFKGFILILKYIADQDNVLPDITFWLMGGFSSANRSDILILIMPVILGVIPIMLIKWKMNVISLGEEEASALGINVNLIKMIIIFSATLMTTATVASGGIISWVGIVVPQMSRQLVGSNFKRLVPVSLLLGSAFLVLADDLSRSMFSIELPIGVLTSLIGGPIFIYIMFKTNKQWMV